MKQKISNFFSSTYYVLTLACITILSWTFDLQLYGLLIMCSLLIYNLLFNKDTSPILPIMLFCSVIFSASYKDINISLLYPIFIPIAILSFVFYFVKNKPKLKKGKYFSGIFIAAIGLSFGGLLFDKNIVHFFTVSAFSFSLVFLYVFFYSTTNIENFKKTFIAASIGIICVVLLQILIFYIRSDNYLLCLIRKSINLGWGNSNNAAFLLNILLPITFLLSIKNRFSYLFLFLAYLQILGIVFTLSRGNFIIGSFMFILLSIISFKNTKYKLQFFITMIVLIIISIMLIFSSIESINIIKENFINKGLDDNGRIFLWEKGLRDFIINPSFGVGFYKDFIFEDNLPLLYHDTPIQILASLGIFGVVSFVVFFIQRYTVPFKKFNLSNFYMFSIIIISALFGLIDGNFTFIYNAFIVIFAYIVIEREPHTENLFYKIKSKFAKKCSNSN